MHCSLSLTHVNSASLDGHTIEKEVCCRWCCQVTGLAPQYAQKCDLKGHQQGANVTRKPLPAHPVSSLCLHAYDPVYELLAAELGIKDLLGDSGHAQGQRYITAKQDANSYQTVYFAGIRLQP